VTAPTPAIRPDVAAFLRLLEDSGQPPLDALPVDGARAMFDAASTMGDLAPLPLAVVRDMAAQTAEGPVPVRLYDRRAGRGPGPLVLFFHGGGFVVGGLASHHAYCTLLADQLDLPVLAVDYRLAPEHPFPAAPADCEAVARWAAGSPAALGLAVTGLVTCGDSAGGNLALVTGQALSADPAAVPVRAAWAHYPVVGGADHASRRLFAEGYMLTAAAADWFEGHYAAPADDPRFACILGPVAPDLPVLIQTAGLDPLRDEGRAYVARCRAAGAPVTHLEAEGQIHGFVCLRGAIPSSRADVDAFIAAARAIGW
jgi:acetyl esterase